MHELVGLHGHPVFLRRDAIAREYDDKALRAALRYGEIARVRHGAYTAADTWAAADPLDRHRLLSYAALQVHGSGVVLSHTSAAAMHHLDVWGADLERVHLTRLDGATTRRCHDVSYHCGRVESGHIIQLGSRHRVTTPPRAALEHAMVTSIESGLVTLDSYLRTGSITHLADARTAMDSWPGSQRLQITLRLTRPGSQSVGETRLRYLCWEFHLPEPDLQVPVYDETGRLIGECDFGWPGLGVLGEFDGKVKYTKHLRPGEAPADAVFREKRREDRIRERSGCSMIRFTWADLSERAQTAHRLRRALGLS